jgi:hypothetical protein
VVSRHHGQVSFKGNARIVYSTDTGGQVSRMRVAAA